MRKQPVVVASPLPSERSPEVIAAVDLGSNSFHMVVARLVDGEPTDLYFHADGTETARILGAGFGADAAGRCGS